MRYLLQRPLPDELLTSVWVRTTRRAGLAIKPVTQALSNGRAWSPSFFSTGHLPDLAAFLGATPIELLWKHTIFPYATAFFEPVVFDGALRSALSTGMAAGGMGPVTQSVSDFVRLRRYCVECAREDRMQWGESYWRRAHNLPGVLICLQHGRVLRETTLRTMGTGAWSYLLPHEVPGIRVLRNCPSPFEIELARRSVAVLERPPAGLSGDLTSIHSPHGPGWYRETLDVQGLVSPGRQVSAQKLVSWAKRLGATKLTRLGFPEKDAGMEWLGLMVRPKISIPFSPLKHLVFETALALSRAEKQENRTPGAIVSVPRVAAATSDASGSRSLSELDHVTVGFSGFSKQVFAARDKQYAATLEAVIAGYLKRGECVRVKDALTEAGCFSYYKHHKDMYPRVSKVIVALRTSSASTRRIFV